MIGPKTRLGALALAAIFVAAACGSSATSAPTGAPGSSAPTAGASGAPSAGAAVSGAITVSGSSTVQPISEGVAELFKEANPGFNYTVEGPGTGDGFKRFCQGEIDISDASRAIKDAEKEGCQAAGVDYVELKIAYDGITVMSSAENTAVTCLSFADLYALVGPESQSVVKKWSDASAIAKELGSNTSFPDADLQITGPGEELGTYDYFVEAAIAPIAKERGKDAQTRPDYQASPTDNVIIEGVAGFPTSLGWVGFAFAEENKDTVSEIALSKEPNGTCVAPTQATISDGSYPLSRPLFIYVNTRKAAENPAVKAYVDFYLAPGTLDKVFETVPYVALPASEIDQTRSAWQGVQ